MRVGVLGPLEVSLRGRPLTVAGPMPRRLLALLAVEPGTTLSADTLMFGLWGDSPPAAARSTLQSHVARLRRALGVNTALLGSTVGYRLDPLETEVDALEFRAAAEQGRRELLDGRPVDAALTLRSALALWRGSAYAEFPGCPALESEADRLEQLRLDAVQWRMAAELGDPDLAPPIAELDALVREYPTREGLWALYMRALYRAGRQAEALDAYRRARELLVDQLGVEPGAELRETERLILNQDASLEPRQRTVAQVPEPVAPAPRRFAPERRVVTVLAIELPGGVTDPEAYAARTRHFRDLVRAQVERFGGSVQTEFGDTVVAVFGAPTTHEDDPVRAVRAAHSIIAGSTAQPKPRAGVSTGDVVYSATGVDGVPAADADRLRVHARPGDLLIDDSTRRVMDAAVAALDVRTVPDAVPAAWRLAGYGRSMPRQVSSSTPFVGRGRDLDLLQAAVERTVVDRFPQVVSIVAEPGLGKTRLVDELAQSLMSRGGVAVYVARCLPYGDGGVLYPLPALVKAYAGVTDSDSEAAALDKIAAKIPPEEHDDLLPHLSMLIGGESAVTQTRVEAFAAWARYYELMAEAKPTVLVLEDVHWASPMLLDFTEAALGLMGAVPMLGLVTARPELLDARPNWGARMIDLRLAPLGLDDTTQLLADLIGERALPADQLTSLAQRCGGVPLYAEEMARLGTQPGGGVPASLTAVLGSRLDTLDDDQRRLLSAASLAGDTFWTDEIADCVNAEPEKVTTALDALVQRQFLRRVRPSRRRGQVEYAFVHDLVRLVAEGRLTRSTRAQHHLALAQWWSATSAERPDDAADLVAHHAGTAYDLAIAAGDDALAEEARGPAAHAAARVGARLQGIDTRTALDMLARALSLTDPDTVEEGRIRYWTGAALHDDRQFAAAEASLLRSIELLERANDPLRVDAALLLISTLFAEGKDWQPALDASWRAVEELPPSRPVVRALSAVAMSQLMLQSQQSLPAAIELADRALGMADELQCGGAGLAQVVRGRARLSLGDGAGMDELEAGLDEVTRYESGTVAIGVRQWRAGALHHWRGPAAELEARQEIERIAAERGLQFITSMGTSEDVRVLCELGRPRAAVALADAIHGQHDEAQLRWAVVQRALALLDLGELDEATVAAVRRTPPADDADLRHVVGAALVLAAHQLALGRREAAAALLTELGPAQHLVARDGAMELLPRLARTALQAGVPELVTGVGDVAVVRTPLRACVQQTVAGLAAEAAGDHPAAAARLRAAVTGWTELGFVVEAALAQTDLDRNLALSSPPA